MNKDLFQIRTLGELKRSGYQVKTLREEMRDNLLARLRSKERIMPGIVGYDATVIPEIENGILAGHHMVFLGERGQAKSRLIRALAGLLDDLVPIVKGSEINDDPFAPISKEARRKASEQGDEYAQFFLGLMYEEGQGAPQDYAAITFHSDDLSDCKWETTIAIEVPKGVPSG